MSLVIIFSPGTSLVCTFYLIIISSIGMIGLIISSIGLIISSIGLIVSFIGLSRCSSIPTTCRVLLLVRCSTCSAVFVQCSSSICLDILICAIIISRSICVTVKLVICFLVIVWSMCRYLFNMKDVARKSVIKTM